MAAEQTEQAGQATQRRAMFTAQWVERVTASTGQREDWFDKKIAGLAVRLTPSGTKTWCVVYRVAGGDGKKRRLTLGQYPTIPLAEARDMAREKLLEAARGKDPPGKKHAEPTPPTFAHRAYEYLQHYATAPRADGRPQKLTWYEDERSLKKDLRPVWGHRKAHDITRRDVTLLLDGIKARGSNVQANRTLALISKVFNVGIDRGLVDQNPAHRMKRPTEEVARERVLSLDELRALWEAFGTLAKRADGKGTTAEGQRLAVMFKVRLLTAQRGGEVSLMRWDDIDLERRLWTIPKDFTKTKSNDHEVPLSQVVVDLITGLTPERTGWVFPSARAKGKPVTNIRKAAERVVTATGIDFTPHDLRRTAATLMTELGVPRLVVSKILNHAEGGTTWKYDRHAYEPEKRDALDRWALRLDEILAGKKSKITELASRQERRAAT